MSRKSSAVAIIGAGLAGSEAALVLAQKGIEVELFEMRPLRTTPAHTTGLPAELVCSNSFKSDLLPGAHGLLKAELALLKSPLLAAAQQTRVPAGSALAVDREQFSLLIDKQLSENPRITITRQELPAPPAGPGLCIITAGPLVSEALASWLAQTCSAGGLYFYDAIAPIVSADSIDMHTAFYAARWGRGGDDYCNCPFTEEQYRVFYDALTEADKVEKRHFEDEKYFEACLPVEEIARRSHDALLFGPLRPVGLTDPRTGKRPYAVCQLRKENRAGLSLNMVGFQTRMTIGAQKRVFRLIPGLELAEFMRYGSVHRNTYVNSPSVLEKDLSFKNNGSVFCAGQLCGSEGYTESIATGHWAALFAWCRMLGREAVLPPATTACGGLLRHVTRPCDRGFTPSNINFGLIEPLPAPEKGKIGKEHKNRLVCERALHDMESWIAKNCN